MDWGAIKRHKRSCFAGAKVTMSMSQAGDEAGDILAVLKNVYQTFSTAREKDNLSEDIVMCLVPGVVGDTPINEPLQTAWRSLKAIGNKHIGPKIGNIRVSQDDILSQIYTRGAWNRPPEHHMVFTYQAFPTESAGRKIMRYLKENMRMGDTIFSMSGRCLCTRYLRCRRFPNRSMTRSLPWTQPPMKEQKMGQVQRW